ncbi:winged helix-turn-helix transcriptional regulator [Chitinophaga varians]|uniref:Winged helix-turn-helix transcriptional regulator n=1 Tax=Chitinophaga varians TaxID=2202339 RepID=A0A847RUD0_9BACT|nr:winged helix-turn-helix domain-containing protein [Chitinophaga varians]NLR64337.1 winged helix-turn-helix transcriptional regulator [Chitinophaga varians]
MPGRPNLLSGKRKYLFGLILFLFVSIITVAFSLEGNDDFDISRREVLLRKIGHELLLQSGDNKSRVLPVKKIAENEYLISFEHDLTFQPDSLVSTTRRLLSQDPLARDYVVNVLNCSNSSVAYGYAISQNKKDDIITCMGRAQPSACYMINIKFKSTDGHTAKNVYLLGSLPFLAFVGFLFLRSVKPQNTPPKEEQQTGMITLGPVLFDANNRKLIVNGQTTELTGTESRVLHIFALSPNETIERSRLQKEIWEDEGVIVGRSLDMFISKLRKKLEPYPNIKIVVIRGKGYRLEISA